MRKPLLVSIPLFALLVAGCQTAPPASSPAGVGSASAGDESASGTPEPTDPATKPTCALASAALVRSTLGLTVGEPKESFDDTEILCTYTSTAGNNPVVKFRTGQDAASFARLRREADSSGDPTRDVEVGQEAYVTAEEFGNQVSNTLVVRAGAIILSVTAAVSVDAEQAFVTKVLASIS
jgi:hypothetical protein